VAKKGNRNMVLGEQTLEEKEGEREKRRKEKGRRAVVDQFVKNRKRQCKYE